MKLLRTCLIAWFPRVLLMSSAWAQCSGSVGSCPPATAPQTNDPLLTYRPGHSGGAGDPRMRAEALPNIISGAPATASRETNSIAARAGLTLPIVNSNAAVKALTAGSYSRVDRAGFAAPGDGGAAIYTWSGSACTLNSGAGDDGSQIAPTVGTGCWIATFGGASATPMVWGAKCDGVTNDLAAFNAALGVTGALVLPAAKCIVAGTINVGLNNSSIIGPGVNVATIVSSSANLPVIKVAGGLSQITLRGFTVDRNVTAMAGGNGIDFTNGITNAKIEDVEAIDQWVGFALGCAAYGQVVGALAVSNYSDGFQFTNSSACVTAQWTLLNTISQGNNGWGYDAIPATGTTMIMLPWVNATSFANTLGGAGFGASGAGTLADIAIVGGVWSSDNGNEIYLNGVIQSAEIGDGAFIELAGTQPSGRGLATAATHNGRGIYATGAVGDFSVGKVTVSANSNEGILSEAFRTQITDAKILMNGQASPGTYFGINISNKTYSTVLISGTISGNLNTTAPQANGLGISNGVGATVIGNDFCFNGTAGLQIGSNSTSASVHGNLCAVYNSSGVSSIAAGQRSVVINHGLTTAPTQVTLGLQSNVGSVAVWTDTYTATSFTVHLASSLSAATNFAWQAGVLNY